MFVRLKKLSKTVFVESLKGTKVRCVLGEQSPRRPDPLRPAPPRRPAVRRPDPTRPWYVRVLDSTSSDYIGFNTFVLAK